MSKTINLRKFSLLGLVCLIAVVFRAEPFLVNAQQPVVFSH
jgi:hypothetical protein